MSYRVLSAILKQPWAIDPRFAESYLPAINNVLNGLTAFEKPNINPVSYAHYEEHGSYTINNELVDNNGSSKNRSVGIITLAGPLMKYDQDCGPMGMQSLGDIIKRMDNNPNIHAIVLRIDSPGGTVSGTQELGNAVRNASKPVIAIVEDLMASAALWVGTGAKEVYASKELDEIGSIGVMMSFWDMIPAMEAKGFKFHSIVATQSKDKNRNFQELRAGMYDNYRTSVLDPMAEQFIKTVKQSRPNVKEEQLTGKVYFAKDLIGSLIDGIKSFDEVIKRAIELSDKKESKPNASHQKTNISMSKTFLNLNKIVGAELQVADGGVFLTEEQAEQVDASLVQETPDNSALTTLQTERDSAIAERDQANATIATRDSRIVELEAEVARLSNAPGATTAKTVAQTDITNEDSSEALFAMDMPMEERIANLKKLEE